MTKSKLLRNTGLVISGIAVLSFVDFLNARVLAPFSPFYKERGTVQIVEPVLLPQNLSKLKVSDTKNILSQRNALTKKAKLEQRALMDKDVMAMMEIGLMYEGNTLGEPDIPQAIYWFQKAADTGNNQAGQHLKTLSIINKFGGLVEKPQNNQTLSLDTSRGLGEALAPAVQDMVDETALSKETSDEIIGEKPNKIVEYLTGKNRDKDIVADTTMSDREKRFLMSLMPVNRLKKIAKTGNTTAQNQLGLKYYDDKKDAKNALYWFMEAAKSDYDTALSNAAQILDSKAISKSSQKETVTWMRQQADKGRAPAQYVVGTFYVGGLYGIEEDKKLGFAWFEKAAKNGSAQAQFELGFAQILGSEIAEDKVSGFNWLSKSATQGYSQGQYWLADAYKNGDGVEKNDALAIRWYERADSSNHSLAALQLVFIYQDLESPEQDDNKARYWAERMISKGNSNVGHKLVGDMYAEGRGYPQNDELAFEHYLAAAEQDNGTAQYKVAVSLLEGRGAEQNKELAIDWLKKAEKNYSYEAEKKLKQLGVTGE